MATAEETKAIKAAAKRAAEQEKALVARDEEIAAQRQDAEEAARGTQAVQDVEPTPAYDEALVEYGPFPEPLVVTTPYGDYGVGFRKVLFFKELEQFNSRINRTEKVMKDYRRTATAEEMKPILAQRAAKKKARQNA